MLDNFCGIYLAKMRADVSGTADWVNIRLRVSRLSGCAMSLSYQAEFIGRKTTADLTVLDVSVDNLIREYRFSSWF